MEATGFCWKCGLPCKEKELFCLPPKKCKERYYRDQDRQIIRGKRDAYGIKGDCR